MAPDSTTVPSINVAPIPIKARSSRVQQTAVPNGGLGPDTSGPASARNMDDAAVLQVGAGPDAYEIHISAHHAAEPDAGPGPDLDVPDHPGRGTIRGVWAPNGRI